MMKYSKLLIYRDNFHIFFSFIYYIFELFITKKLQKMLTK